MSVISGKRKMELSNEEKILRALYVVHQENEHIMATILAHYCYPKDYEKAKDDMIKDWDRAFDEAIGINEKK